MTWTLRRAAAGMVHGYTALGALCALLSLNALAAGRLREAFAWLAVQVAIDASDGWLARLVDVNRVLPHIDGNRLDDIVDYLSYVFVPAAIVVSAGVVPGVPGWIVAATMLVSSGFGFARSDAKTADHFFTGFPSYWNIIVLYLVALGSGPLLSGLVLGTLAMLVFVPVRYIYPSRTPVLRPLTLALGLIWALCIVATIATLPDVPASLLYASSVFPIYYVGLSLVLEWQRRLRLRDRMA